MLALIKVHLYCIEVLLFVFLQWFRENQFGTAWSVLSTSMNVAGTVGPLITAYITTSFGWRTSLYAPGLCTK